MCPARAAFARVRATARVSTCRCKQRCKSVQKTISPASNKCESRVVGVASVTAALFARVSTRAMAAMMEGMVDKVVQVVTNDGRNIVGLLKGFDQTTNVILDECHERVFSSEAGVEQARASIFSSQLTRRCAYSSSAPCIGLLHRSFWASTLCVATTCACGHRLRPRRCGATPDYFNARAR